ncbi:MAG: nucleoside hydrolase [Candidatus Nanohaloarchaea archaeon]
MKKLVIDTDPGVDDALAIIYASQKTEIEAITTVCGNVGQSQALRNANFLRELLDLETEVCRGSEKPIERDLDKPSSHGKAGLGNSTPRKDYERSSGEAVERIVSMADPDRELVALGPLTNICKAVKREPGILTEYGSFTLMGGAIRTAGNINRVAEYNFWADPEAADKTLRDSGYSRIVPVNLCRKTCLDLEFMSELPQELREISEPYIRYYRQKKNKKGGVMYDPLTVGLALNPELGARERLDIRVETRGKYTRGMAVTEQRDSEKEENCEVFTGAETDKIQGDFQDCLKSASEDFNKSIK